MDILIMEVAIYELIDFPTIPINVTLNEYIEIAKSYSTDKSGTFINGVLDNIVRKLKEENKLIKAVVITK
jgi:N utilization substance protein B